MSASDDRLSSAEVEHQAEDVRAELAHTLNQLRDNLRPEHVVDEVVSNARIGASTIADRLFQVARDNPLPTLLIGLGATMIAGIGGIGARSMGKPRETAVGASTYPKPPLGRDTRATARLAALDPRRADADPAAFPKIGPSSAKVRDTMNPSSRYQPRRPARPMEPSRLSGMLDEQPMILAALGIAVGAAIGAVLPTTRIENDWVGSTSSSVRSAAADAARSEIDELSDVAGRTAHNLRQTAADHGLSGDNVNGLMRDVGEDARTAIHDVGERFRPA